MKASENLFTPLFEKTEQYCRTSFELIKLKSLNKSSDVLSTLISKTCLIIFFLMFLMTLSIAFALWASEFLGKIYYGFFVIALFYALAAILIFLIHPVIKSRLKNAIIKQMFN